MKIEELPDFWIFSQKDLSEMRALDVKNEAYSIIRCNNFDENNYLRDHLTYVESMFSN